VVPLRVPVSVPGEPVGGDFWKLGVWGDSHTFSTRDLVRSTGSGGTAGITVFGDFVAAFDREAMLGSC
jgi:hypothetical protein